MKPLKVLTGYAAKMQARPTASERLFAKRLTALNIKFDSQVIIPPYIVDFLLPERRLVIEIDGECHQDRARYDANRDKKLRRLGFEVVRIQNADAKTFHIQSLLEIPALPLPEKKPRKYKAKPKPQTKGQRWLANNRRKQKQIERRMHY